MQLADANERRAFCGAVYYIMRGADPAARNFNAMLLLHEGIRIANACSPRAFVLHGKKYRPTGLEG